MAHSANRWPWLVTKVVGRSYNHRHHHHTKDAVHSRVSELDSDISQDLNVSKFISRVLFCSLRLLWRKTTFCVVIYQQLLSPASAMGGVSDIE